MRVDKHKKKEKRVFEKAFRKMDGVFSDNREAEEDFDKPGAGTFARWFGWLGRATEQRFGDTWPWLGAVAPLIPLAGRSLGQPLGIGSEASSRMACSCVFLLGGLLQLRWAQRRHWLPGWLNGVQSGCSGPQEAYRCC